MPFVVVTVVRMRMVTFVPPQYSIAVGESNVQMLPHSAVLLGAQVINGAGVITLTVWVHWTWLPQASVASQIRVAT
jgi:hypothetical protein